MSAFSLKSPLVALMLAVAGSASLHAEITKEMLTCNGQLCPFFKTSLKPPQGWHEDKEAGRASHVTMLVPDGADYQTAGAVIYADARYNPTGRTVDQSVSEDVARWKKKAADAVVTPLPQIVTASGAVSFKRNLFAAPSLTGQPYEIVAVAADKDKDGNNYILYAVLTALSEADLKQAEPAFETALKAY
jgi:hypothetical protein